MVNPYVVLDKCESCQHHTCYWFDEPCSGCFGKPLVPHERLLLVSTDPEEAAWDYFTGKNYSPIPLKEGDTVVLYGDSATLGLDDYNVRVSTTAIVLETPKDEDRDVLVNIMEIDGDANVMAYVHRDKIRREV